MRDLIFLILVCMMFTQCNRQTEKGAVAVKETHTKLKYAQGFNVTEFENYKIVEVNAPYKGARSGYKYLLLQKGNKIPAHDSETKLISVPLETIVCTSTTHIPLLDYLDETSRLVGFPTTDYISSENMRKRIDAGKVQELGIDNGMNIEQLAVLRPSMVMGYTMTSEQGQLKKIQELGIPVVMNAEYLERHPLGRAEWIKFMALFFNKERQADSVFDIIESGYLSTQKLVNDNVIKPTVMSGIVYGGTWFLPGGQNYAAKLFDDAGLQYIWRSDSSSSFLELSFEAVYDKAKNSDLWIGVGSFSSLAGIAAAEERYTKFQAFRKGNVYTYNVRKGAKGGSEFLELGYLRPDYILKDLVKIGHPELLPGYKLFFHGRLK